jgi:hypothetical protein
MGAKLLVAILFVIAAGQLAFIVFQTVRLWLFG